MGVPIAYVTIRMEHDIVETRQRARQIARLLGFDVQDQTRIATAVSEIARNAHAYAGGGKAEFLLEGSTPAQMFTVKISDTGPGVKNLPAVLDGRYESHTGMGLGIAGARRLMDRFEIQSEPGLGTTVQLKKLLPKRSGSVSESEITGMVAELSAEAPRTAVQELQFQNRELFRALEEIRMRQIELARVNQELEDTNRGVVALYAELDEKADHLRRADELKSKFLSNMSHEFRSPLNSILALSSLLMNHCDGELSPEQEQQVGYIGKAANDLLEMVNDLLDLAKVESGKLEAKPIDFRIADLFAALRGMLRPLLLNTSVELVFEDVCDLPDMYSDEAKISQILRNFISNALKFTERGEVRVSAEASGDNQVAFSVSDTGIGIAPQNLDSIFQDFMQIDHPIQRVVKGTGLGLPLSAKLAGFLGGRIEVKSEINVGSTFTVRLPLRFKEPRGATGSILPTDAIAEPDSRAILFVDRSHEAVMAYESFLKGSGFQAISAPTAKQAREILRHISPAAVVVDLGPGRAPGRDTRDAWALIAELKQCTGVRTLPVLAAGTTDDEVEAYDFGVDGYLVKPVDGELLMRELTSLVGKESAHRVLIVDDSELDRYLLKQQLRSLSLVITEEPSGSGGLHRARSNVPDLIFLDLSIPDMSGFEVLDRLKSAPEVSAIPVIVITSGPLTARDRERLAQKTVGIFEKNNLNESELLALVRSNLKVEAAHTRV